MKTYFTKLLRVALLLLVMLLQGAAATVALADGEHSITTIVEGQGTATVWDYSGENQINTAPEGNLFRLVATPAEGWRFVEWQLVSGDGNLQYPTYQTAYYRIGYQDAVIRAVFEGIPHTVSTMSTPNLAGAVEVSLDNTNWSSSLTASVSTTVYFRFHEPSGFRGNGYSIETESCGLVSPNSNHFTMPNENVTVSGAFIYDGVSGDPHWVASCYSLKQTKYTITNSGFSDITCSFNYLMVGNIEYQGSYYQTGGLNIEIVAGELTDGAGNNIPFLVDKQHHNNPSNSSCYLGSFHSPDETIIMSIWIDPVVYNNTEPGTYTGNLHYNADWGFYDHNNHVQNISEPGFIALTLVISEFDKEITGYGTGSGGWQLIASPLAGATNVENVDNLINTTTPANYDLYRFNQAATKEWENHKVHHSDSENPFNALVSGHGYLYANANTTTLTFRGTPYSGNGQVTLAKTADAQFGEWNLIGNPFGTAATLDMPFYRMNEGGTALSAQVEANNTVATMEGVFVQAAEDGQTAKFTQVENSKGDEKSAMPMLNINLSHNHGEAIDNAIIRFDGGQTLGKFTLHEDDSKLYIPQDGKNYAIANAETTGEMPLNFKATKNGEYTLSINPDDVELGYLHLIDNMTGADVDLLHPNAVIAGEDPQSPAPSYTFSAKTTDYESRFRLVFAAGSNSEDADGDNETFAFVSNGNIIVNGTGTLQVIDILGRQHYAKELSTANCQLSTANFPAGMYVLRLINGDNVKTQKIVVR